MDMKNSVLKIGSGQSALVDSQAGHFAVDLAPASWLALKDSSLVRSEAAALPRRLEPPRRQGPPRRQVYIADAKSSKGWLSRVLKILAPMTACATFAAAGYSPTLSTRLPRSLEHRVGSGPTLPRTTFTPHPLVTSGVVGRGTYRSLVAGVDDPGGWRLPAVPRPAPPLQAPAAGITLGRLPRVRASASETLEASAEMGHCNTCGRHAVVEKFAQNDKDISVKSCRLCEKHVCSTDCPKCFRIVPSATSR